MLTLGGTFPIQAHNAGLFVSRGEGMHPERVIDSWELIFVRSGRLDMHEEGAPFHLAAGQALLLRPGKRHGGLSRYAPDLSFYWVHFELTGAPGKGRRGPTVSQVAEVGRPDLLAALFRRFLDDQESGALQPYAADLLVLQMLCEVAAPGQRQADTAAVLASRAEAHIRSHFHEPLSTAAIADELGCNPDYLGRVFHHAYGITLTDAIHRQRLWQARRLLMDSALNVDEVAMACGFADAGYFRRLFKRREGLTPLAYRRLYARVHVNTE